MVSGVFADHRLQNSLLFILKEFRRDSRPPIPERDHSTLDRVLFFFPKRTLSQFKFLIAGLLLQASSVPSNTNLKVLCSLYEVV